MKKIIVIGGGAAGMIAAIAAAQAGSSVTLYEKNEKLGKKVYITGKGRCNVTNACDVSEFFDNVSTNEKFLYSAIYSYTNQDVMDFLVESGCPLKIERGERVFPVSDHASDIIGAFQRKLRETGVTVHLNTEVKDLLVEDNKIKGVILKGKEKVIADAVIIATGGLSYPTTGSTGDGYRFAKETGHKLIDSEPSLVPFEVKESWPKELQGLSLKNVELTIQNGKKEVFSGFGEMMFTHFGITGPLVLSASSIVKKPVGCNIHLDLKPALTIEQLDKRILREFEQNLNRQFKNSISSLFPAKLIPVMITLSGIDPEKKIHDISKEERKNFAELIKDLPMTISGTRGFNEAIITRGGVNVRDIDPSTMESKRVEGLYFAGEVIDTDAVTGGFNLQIAWSTGHLAGVSAANA